MFLNKNISRILKISLLNGGKPTYVVRSLSTVDNEKNKGHYDVIIAGGGMVGCTLACAMTKDSLLSKLKILLLESGNENKIDLTPKPEYSNRVVALNQSTKSLMSSLNIWKHVKECRLQPVRYMQVWDACSDAMITFSSADNIVDDDISYIVENDILLHAINTELATANPQNLQINYRSNVNGYVLPKEEDSSTVSVVKMGNGDQYTCQLLIGADGANSAVRKAMGVQYLSWNYDQMGVVATVYLAEETENTTAWQRMLPSGPVALLPLDSKRSSLVWSTWQDNAKQLLQLPEDQFVDALNDALWKEHPRKSGVDAATNWVSTALRQFGLQDGAVRQLPPSIRGIAQGSRAAFPLAFGHSTKYIGPGVALIGDAAHRVHPLAGQGVNLGFGDVKDLTEMLSNTIYSGLEIAHPSWLIKYETARQRHNLPTQVAIEALHRLYTADLAPVVLIRSLGLQLTNALYPIKARELIALVYEFMKNEAKEGVMNVTDARWRTSQATGVSEKTVSRILKEKRKADETGSPMRSPHRNKKPRKCMKRDMAENDKELIRYTVNNFQRDYNKAPTLNGLKEVLKERMNFTGCIETLRRVLLEIGYEFKSTKNHSARHKKLVEKERKDDSKAANDSITFLSNYQDLKPEGSSH